MITKILLPLSVSLATFVGCSSTKSIQKRVYPLQSSVIVNGDLGIRLDSLLTPYVNDLRKLTNNETGLSIGVTKGDEVIFARSFGYSNLEKTIKADFNTLFHIASVSKPFTAAAIVKLIEQGKLELDDYIIEHLPEFEMKDDRFRRITIRHILNHSSGIPRHISSGDWDNPVFGEAAIEKTMDDFKGFDLDFDPGTDFSYSNSGFDLLGILIRRVSNMSYETYLQTYILEPSGMTHSKYLKPTGSLPDNWAVPYSYGLESQEWSPYPYAESYFPSSGLQTTLLDMCQWGMLHVKNGKHLGKEVLSDETFSLLIEPSFDTPWGSKIGLGWFLQSYLDRPIIMHQGSDTGFESIMYVYPNDSVSIVVMANRDFSRTGRIINATSEILFGEQAKEYTVSAKYLFTEAYQKAGIQAATQLWNDLAQDTTDIYYVDNEDVLTTGAVLENGRNWTASKEILEYYLTLDSLSTYAWRLLGNSHLGLGDLESAEACYEQTLRINPDYQQGKDALIKLKH